MNDQPACLLNIPIDRNRRGNWDLIISRCEIAPNSVWSNPDPDSSWREYCCAVWDTGANVSAISSRVVSECGLTPMDKPANIKIANGKTDSRPMFVISLRLPNGVRFLGVLAGVMEDDDVDILIGMNVILHGELSVTGDPIEPIAIFKSPPINHGWA